jgi:tetratricopeptide (TPR) repeat protein
LLLVSFAAAALARLNSFCWLEPDSADYLTGARALAHFQGYRAIDEPAGRPYTFRPPGLPLLLIPVAWLPSEHLVLAAKITVVLCTVLMLAIVWRYAQRHGQGGWAALAALAMVATSPFTLLLGTEVLSEAPYVAGSLAVLLLLDRAEPKWSRPEWAVLAALLVYLPMLRTVGVTFVAAIGLWALFDQRRRPLLFPVAASGVVFLLWMVRNATAGGYTYAAATVGDIGRGGLALYLINAARAVLFYSGRLVPAVLPGLHRSQSQYDNVFVEPPPALPGLEPVASALLGLVVVLAAIGMYARRREGGSLAAASVAGYLLALVVFPMRHDRLLWPLVPFLWSFAPAGLTAVRTRIKLDGPLPRAGIALAAAAITMSIAAWQGLRAANLVMANLQATRGGQPFYAEQVPPFYYCDWKSAGRWLAENTPPHARLITRHSDVVCTARRFQWNSRFDAMLPANIRQSIADLPAGYLVVQTSLFGRGFAWEMLDNDPVYQLRPVYESGNVAVLQVEPNRTGTVRKADRDLTRHVTACRQAAEQFPQRRDLRERLAALLFEAGRPAEALPIAQALVAESDEVTPHRLLARVQIDLGRYDDAVATIRRAQFLPEAEVQAAALSSTLRLAEAYAEISRSGGTPRHRADAHLLNARRAASQLAFARAWRELERAVELAPRLTTARVLRAELLQRFGQFDAAESELQSLEESRDSKVLDKLRLLRLAAAIERSGPTRFLVGPQVHTADPRDVRDYVTLARLYRADGTPGRALDLLERAEPQFPNSADLLVELAGLYRYYADLARCDETYRRVLKLDPTNRDAQRGLVELKSLLRRPAY